VPTNRHLSLTFFNVISGRSRVDFVTGTNVRQKFYASDGSAEITRLPSGQVEIAIFLGGDAYSAPAVLHNNANNQNNVLYLHRDYVGSIVGISNQTGTITERRHFDAWRQLTHFWRLDGSENVYFLP